MKLLVCLHSNRLRYIIFFTILLLLFSGRAWAQAPAPTITSFTPGTVCQGQTITITGTEFTGASAVMLGSTNALGFTVNSPTSITATVSYQAATGPVTVTTSGGTVVSSDILTILPAPVPVLKDESNPDQPFTNCSPNAAYQLKVSNLSVAPGTGNVYQINWGDNSAPFTQTDWPANAQTTHTYSSQGYFTIVLTITPTNGCTKSITYSFYNGVNPIASLSTTGSTTGLCVETAVEFQIGNWFTNSAGTTYRLNFGDGTPPLVLPHPLNATNGIHKVTHTYTKSSCPDKDFTATLDVINGCYTTKYTLNQIIVRQKPAADFKVPSTTLCENTSVCFTNLTRNGSSGINCSSNSTFTWDFGDNSPTSNLENPCHTYTNAGTYTVTLTAGNNSCGNDVKTKQIIINPISPKPLVVTPVTYCVGQAAVPLSATGTGLLWYTTATGGAGSPTAPTPSTATAGTKTYYVSQTLPNHCESPREIIVVTVNALPPAPTVVTPVQLCLNQVAPPLTANGTNLLWYTTPTGGVGSPVAPTPSTAVIGTTTYYVSQTTGSCEGPRAAITVIVNALAVAPVVTSPVVYCQNQAATPLQATGSGLLWYTAATGGTGSNTAPTPSTATPGSTTYYVSQVTGCGEGPRAAITVEVNAAPNAVIAYTPAVLCNTVHSAATPNPPVAVNQTGTPGGSYSISPVTGLPINPVTGEINPSGATAGIYTISYTIPAARGCPNYTVTTSVTINNAPAATITYPGICTSDAATVVTRTGTAGGIFTSTAGLTIDPATGTITPGTSVPGTYVVTYTVAPVAPCPGFTTTTNVTVSQAPTAAIAYTPAILCNVVNTATTPNPPVTVTQTGTPGGSYSITPATGLPIDVTTGEINPSGAVAGVYTIGYTIPGAGGCANYTVTTTVTINNTPSATITYPGICTSDAATAVNRSGTGGGTFTSTTGLTIDPVTGTITPGTSVPGTYVVTYTIAPAAPCPGFTTTASVTVTQAPSAAIAYTPAILCNVANTPATPNLPVAVNQTGTPGGSYSISPATGLPINVTTGEINPAGATAGVYTIKYTVAGTGACTDYNATTTVTVNSTPVAAIQYNGTPYCGAITTPQHVLLSGTPGGTFSATPGLSINTATGDINPAQSTPGVHTVTYTIAAAPPCPGYVTTTSVTIVESPVVSFPVNNQAICSGGTAAFVPSSTVVNTTYAWSVAGALPPNVSGPGSGTSSGTISLSFTNTGTVNQTITIRVIPTNPSPAPCAGTPYDLTLLVRPVVPPPVTTTANFCMDMPPAALRVNPLPGNTIKWYDKNMVVLNAAPVINTAVPGLSVYYVSQVTVNGCESPAAKMEAIVHPTAKIVSTSYAHPTSCGVPSGSITLHVLDLSNGAIPNLPVVVHYNKFQTAYTINSTTDASGKITIPLTAGTYSQIFVETSGGCVSQKIQDVFVLKDPTPPAQPVAGYNPPLCSEQPLKLTALSATGTQAGPVKYVWAGPAFGPDADTVNNTVVTFPSVAVSDAGTYIVYAIQNNCISLPATFDVKVHQSPAKPVISARTPLCVGDDLALKAFSSIPGNASLNYTWNGPGTGFPVNSPDAEIKKISLKDAGIYTVTVTSPQTGCSSTSDKFIQVGDYPIVAFAQDTLVLATGSRIKLAPVITNAADPGIMPIRNYTWTPTQDLECNGAVCSAPVVTVKDDICYHVKVTNTYGCSASDDVCIRVFCQQSQVFIPNAFAPTGNVPENRKLMVRGSGIASVKSFRVFNRWGRIMFERNNFPPNSPDYGWDGMVNGKQADTGVYIYTVEVICENGVPYTFKGNVTLF